MIVGALVLVEVTAGITEGVVAYPLFLKNRRSGFRAFMVGPIPVSENVSVRPMGEVDIAAGRSLLGQLGCELTLAEMRRRFIEIAGSAGHGVRRTAGRIAPSLCPPCPRQAAPKWS